MKVYIGIDWSENEHAVVFMNEAGVDLANFTIPHSPEGFARLDAQRRQWGLEAAECPIGLETAHNILIDYLWSQNYTQVYVLPPSQVQANQGRFRQSGASDDPAAARLIADILRTDRGRFQPWQPDSLLTRQMRAQISLILHLNQQIRRTANRLRAVLLRYYPAAVHVFKTGLANQIAPALVIAYPTPQAARALSPQQFEDFALQHGYPSQKRLVDCYARLQAAYPQASAEVITIYQEEAVLLAQLVLKFTRAKLDRGKQLQTWYGQHPNHDVFASLPCTGEFIGPALLAKFGDDPDRFPTAASCQALAGTAPITKRSGKHIYVQFRQACDKEWRYICQEWAAVLVGRYPSPIAQAYWNQIRPHCHSDAHAYRCVANRWLAIAHKLWHDHQTYEEAYHLQQRALRAQPR